MEKDKNTCVIDATGCAISPGFIDMHSHADFSLPLLPTADSLVHQGITTAVVGQCGLSPAPLFDHNREEVIAGLTGLIGGLGANLPWEKWSTFADYLNFLTGQGVSINVAPLVGQGTIRASVMEFGAGRANPEQMERMQSEVIKALQEGAIGISTGLIYPPGSYADKEELTELTKVIGKRKGFYFSHIRGESDTLLDAVNEAIQIGRYTGAPVEISHFKASGRKNWFQSAEALKLIEEALAERVDVAADMYPYTAGSTGLAAMLPEWVLEGGKEATLMRLYDPDSRSTMMNDMRKQGLSKDIEWHSVLINGSLKRPKYQGRYVSDLAEDEGKTPYEWIFDALLDAELKISIVLFGMSEENRKQEMKHPAMIFGTDGMGFAVDGPMSKGLPHPRSYGTFPRILGRYVREQGVLSFEEAIRKMTGLAAKRLRLKDRGLIKPGYVADLVIFDPETVIDKATYKNPHQYPEGINHVIVNGQFVVRDAKHTGALSGQILRLD